MRVRNDFKTSKRKKMKNDLKITLNKILFIAIFFFAMPIVSAACDITCTVDGIQKATYRVGDVVVIKIIVKRTHRNCAVDINETKITVSGMEIKCATKWVNTTGSIWERKMKVSITSNKEGKAMINAKRSCTKDGGSGTLTLSAVPIK